MVTWWLLACRGPEVQEPQVEPNEVSATWTPDPTHPTRALVNWDPPVPATVSWRTEHEAVSLTAEAPPLMMVGLPAGSSVIWSVETEQVSSPEHQAEIPSPPVDLQPWVINDFVPGASALDEHWFVTVNFTFREGGSSYAVVVDTRGQLRWWRGVEPGRRVLRARRSRDGSAILWASVDNRNTHREPGLIIREPLDGSAPIVTQAPFFHHDFVETDRGYAYLAYVDRTVHQTFRDLPMTSDAVVLVDLGATGATEEIFNFFDDWPEEPSQPCSHSLLGTFVPGRSEWTHSNSLVAAPNGGWWILPRYLDQIAYIGPDGTVGDIIGGKNPTLTFEREGLPMAHGHFSHITEEGHLLVFSNGDHEHQVEGSRVVELAADPAAGVVREVWSTPEPEGRFVGFLGDAIRVADHTLIVNPNVGIWELDGDGRTVRLSAHVDPIEIGRVEPTSPFTQGIGSSPTR